MLKNSFKLLCGFLRFNARHDLVSTRKPLQRSTFNIYIFFKLKKNCPLAFH
jgi:hypothetical protein